MRALLMVTLLGLTTPVLGQEAPRAEQAVIGEVLSYECADSCYLTIATSSTTELTGLCAAEACGPWNEAAALPAELVGKRVVVVLDVGSQYDAAGNQIDSFIAFVSVEF